MFFARLPPVSKVTGNRTPEECEEFLALLRGADLIASHNRRLRSLRSLTSGYLPCTPPACADRRRSSAGDHTPRSRTVVRPRRLKPAPTTSCQDFSKKSRSARSLGRPVA